MKTIQTLSINESHALLNSIRTLHGFSRDDGSNHRNYTIALCMLDAGLRVGEVVQLKISDLYKFGAPVNSLIVRADVAKGSHERIVPTSSRLKTAIELMYVPWWRFVKDHENSYAFFGSDTEHHITIRSVQRLIAAHGLVACQRVITPHMLRHTFATRLMKLTDIRTVQELLGHKCLTSTQIYTHPNTQDLTTAIDQLDRLNGDAKPVTSL